MKAMDRTTGYRLLEAGTVTDFEIAKTQVHRGTDPAEFSLQIELNFPADPETEETDLDWGAFGFLFVIGTLSFAEARPREASIIEYEEDDEFRLDDLIDCLHWATVPMRLRKREHPLDGRRTATPGQRRAPPLAKRHPGPTGPPLAHDNELV